MYATTGGSGGITTDPGPQTGKEEEEKMGLKTSSEQTRREKTIVARLLQEIRRYEAGEGEGQEREYSKIPILDGNMSELYIWAIDLRKYISIMV